MVYKLLILPFILSFTIAAYDDSFPELEKEIQELQKKISETKKKITKVKKIIKKDEKAYTAYEKQQKGYYGKQEAERDSLKNDYARLQRKTDSLAQSIKSIKRRQHELDLLQERFTALILNSCTALKETLSHLPAGTYRNQLSSLEFLASELSVKAVDNTEALERLWQILDACAEAGQSVDVFSGQSPAPAIQGQVDFIRLGFAYCAIVNEQGTAGALWIPADDSAGGRWATLDNPQHLLALKKCVAIRQGNIVPEIVGIPCNHPIVDDSRNTKGGKQ